VTATGTNGNGYAWFYDSNNPYSGGYAYDVGTAYPPTTTTDDYCFYLHYQPQVTFIGPSTNSAFGWSVSSAGNVDSVTHDDVLVGAPYGDYTGRTDCGAAYIFCPPSGGWSVGTTRTAGTDQSGENQYYCFGETDNDHFGWSVCKAGDLNGDGYNDIIAGAPDRDDTANSYTDSGWGQVLSVIPVPEFSAMLIAIFIPFGLSIIVVRRKRRRANAQ
jgi:hypothetical protein